MQSCKASGKPTLAPSLRVLVWLPDRVLKIGSIMHYDVLPEARMAGWGVIPLWRAPAAGF